MLTMNKKEFIEEVKELSNVALQRSNNLLKCIGRDVKINWDYDFKTFDNTAIGVYEHGSVHNGTISIGMNIGTLWNVFLKDTKSYPYTSKYKILQEMILTNVYHEVGHGICDYIEDILQFSDDFDEIYDKNQQLFDGVLDNEEDSVEEFAWNFYDNELNNSDLYKVLSLCCQTFVSECRQIIKESLSNFKLDDFEQDDFWGGRTVWELSDYHNKPYVRRLNFDSDEELEKTLNTDKGKWYFPSEEMALNAWNVYKNEKLKSMNIPTEEDTNNLYNTNNNFKKWFGNSVVKNEDGSPKIVFHGTGKNFDEFKDCGYIFLASSPELARDYAYEFYDRIFQSIPIRTKRGYNKPNDVSFDVDTMKFPSHIEVKRKWYNDEDIIYLINKENNRSMHLTPWTDNGEIENFIDTSKTQGGVHPLYCKIEKPYRLDAKGRNWENIDGKGHIAEDFINMAKSSGCDGLIIDNVVDGSGHNETQYIPFSPNQVKHAYNVGSYSSDTNNMWENINRF